MLAVQNLVARYGGATVLSDVTLDAPPGAVTVLMGRNGAGKSTTIKAIMGLVRPAGGTVTYEGARIDGLAPHRIARLGLGYVPEERRIFAGLTVAENLDVGRHGAGWDEAAIYDLFPALRDLRDRPAGRMSGGEQQMLAIARTLMGNPRLLLLDEPSEGLAPKVVDQIAATVLRLKAQGLSVLLSEQNLRFAALVGDTAHILFQGRIVHRAPVRAVLADEAVRRDYLAV